MTEMNENYELTEVEVMETESGSGLAGKLILGGLALAGAAGAAYLVKTKKKREDKQIEKLRKKGYTITEPVVVEVVDEDEVVVEETKEETK